jgi:hypothetical protein
VFIDDHTGGKPSRVTISDILAGVGGHLGNSTLPTGLVLSLILGTVLNIPLRVTLSYRADSLIGCCGEKIIHERPFLTGINLYVREKPQTQS